MDVAARPDERRRLRLFKHKKGQLPPTSEASVGEQTDKTSISCTMSGEARKHVTHVQSATQWTASVRTFYTCPNPM